MKQAKVLNQKEVRSIIAEHFGVSEEQVINSKYSYIVIDKEENDNENDSE